MLHTSSSWLYSDIEHCYCLWTFCLSDSKTVGPRVRVTVFIRASQLAKGKALTGRHFGGQVPEGIRGEKKTHREDYEHLQRACYVVCALRTTLAEPPPFCFHLRH